jgi:hypothetical protein
VIPDPHFGLKKFHKCTSEDLAIPPHLLEHAQATHFLKVKKLIHTYWKFKLNTLIVQTNITSDYKSVHHTVNMHNVIFK